MISSRATVISGSGSGPHHRQTSIRATSRCPGPSPRPPSPVVEAAVVWSRSSASATRLTAVSNRCSSRHREVVVIVLGRRPPAHHGRQPGGTERVSSPPMATRLQLSPTEVAKYLSRPPSRFIGLVRGFPARCLRLEDAREEAAVQLHEVAVADQASQPFLTPMTVSPWARARRPTPRWPR